MKRVDESVSPFWQRDDGLVVRYHPDHGKWYELNGECAWSRVQNGNWMPWTPPKFPVRKKCDIRLCRITAFGKRQLASWTDCEYSFRVLIRKGQCDYFRYEYVSDIEWLSPEYEDELGATDAQPTSR